MAVHPYYDEEGDYHIHNTNTIRTTYRCSNGHAWVQKQRNRCQCGWRQSHFKYEFKDGTPQEGTITVKYYEKSGKEIGKIFSKHPDGTMQEVISRELTDEELIFWEN